MSKYLELFKGSFDETINEKTKVENKPYVAYSIADGKVAYTIVPKEEGTKYTIYRVVSKDISGLTYNMVDLGLSVKWADRNVGAANPEHCGSYFQWGDTNAYTFDGVGEVTAAELATLFQILLGDEVEITADNVGEILEMMGITSTDLTFIGIACSLDKEFNWNSYNEVDEITDWGEDYDGNRCPTNFRKYNNSENGLKVLESVNDAATVHMGTQYRIPTDTEIRELMSGTTLTFISTVFDENGKNEYSQEEANNGAIETGNLKGVRFTSKTVKDSDDEFTSIFIPAAGRCEETILYNNNSSSYLWSSNLWTGDDYSYSSKCSGFSWDGSISNYAFDRYLGLSIRGVQA